MSNNTSDRVTRSQGLAADAHIVGLTHADHLEDTGSETPRSPDFYSTAPTLQLPIPPNTMVNPNASDPNTPGSNPPAQGTVLQPSFRITKFDGTGSLHINRLIRDVEDFIKSAHPNTSDADRGPLCLRHVSSRLDTANTRVRDILTGLEAEPVVTWEGFKERFREAFAPTPRPPYIELARLLVQKTPLTNTADMISHLGRTQEALKKMLVAMEQGLNPRWKPFADFIRANYTECLTFFLLTNYTMHLAHNLQEALASKLWATPPPTVISYIPRYFCERYAEVAPIATTPNLSIQPASRKQVPEKRPTDPRMAGPGDWIPKTDVCFRCLKGGHNLSNCRGRPFCPWHARDGHTWNQCRSYPARIKRTWDLIKERKMKGRETYQKPNNNTTVHFLERSHSE